MPEYRVTYTEVPAQCEEKEKYGGLLIRIRPPVQLNPDAIERYLSYYNLESIDRSSPPDELKDVVVLGSTPEHTTIYASTDRVIEGLAQETAEKTVEFLQLMGAQAIVEHT